MRMDVETNQGQLSGGDIHNTQDITGNSNIMVGEVCGNLSINLPGEIHVHVTLASDELLAALTDLLKLATSGNQKLSC